MQNKTQQQRCLFNDINLDIIWLNLTAPEFFYNYFFTSHEIFLSLKYSFHFFVLQVDCTFHKNGEE